MIPMEDKKYCVYKHTCPNGKVYIGITSQLPKSRWAKGRGYKRNKLFNRAIEKYGWDNIAHEVLFSDITKEEACEKEVALIKLYKATNPKHGYNCSSGGESGTTGWKPTSEHVKKMHEGGKKYWDTHPEERKARAAGAKKYWEEHHDEMRGHMESAIRYWKDHPEETKARLKKASKASAEVCRKPIICIELNRFFYSEKDAIKALNMKPKSNIRRVARGKSKTSGGYHWRYATEEEIQCQK